MANRFWNFVSRFTAGTLAKAEDVNTNFDGVEAGLTAVEGEVDQAIRVTNSPGTVNIALNAVARAGLVLSFDSNGDVAATTELGEWRGDHADAAGTDYAERDSVSDAAGALKLDSIYRCKTTHTSTGTLAVDTANWELVIDMTDAKASEAAAAASSAAAATSESNAATSESNSANNATASENSKTYSAEWANKAEDSLVSAAAGGDQVDDYSALHWAAKAAASASGILSSNNTFTGINTFTKTQKFGKGADLTSAAELVLGTDGNYFDIGGTATITSIATVGIGTVIKLHFDIQFTIAHHATNLILPGNVNIITAAGDEAEFVEYATGDWRCVNYSKADGSTVADLTGDVTSEGGATTLAKGLIQLTESDDSGAFKSIATTTPAKDNTIPLVTEGDEILTAAITPVYTDSFIKVSFDVSFANQSISASGIFFLVDKTGATTLKVMARESAGTNSFAGLSGSIIVASSGTSENVYSLRAGTTSGLLFINGESGAQQFGGAMKTQITLEEIK